VQSRSHAIVRATRRSVSCCSAITAPIVASSPLRRRSRGSSRRQRYRAAAMDFSLSPEQQQIRESIFKLCSQFDDDYWLAKDRAGDFPHDFHRALAQAGWLGIAMPTEYGGSGLGITEAAIMMQAVAESGAAMSGASAVHMNIFGLQPIVVLG